MVSWLASIPAIPKFMSRSVMARSANTILPQSSILKMSSKAVEFCTSSSRSRRSEPSSCDCEEAASVVAGNSSSLFRFRVLRRMMEMLQLSWTSSISEHWLIALFSFWQHRILSSRWGILFWVGNVHVGNTSLRYVQHLGLCRLVLFVLMIQSSSSQFLDFNTGLLQWHIAAMRVGLLRVRCPE